jgi:hypothetical protein
MNIEETGQVMNLVPIPNPAEAERFEVDVPQDVPAEAEFADGVTVTA